MRALNGKIFRNIAKVAILTALAGSLTGCYILNFFKRDAHEDSDDDDGTYAGAVIGQSLGAKAGGIDEAALAAVHEVGTTHAPAAIRPDPDLFVRRLLRQYRAEGATVARQIGEVEQFRLLLGGASQDFAKTPQETYDATSLLAVSKVAEEVCRGLVAPNSSQHGTWRTILPYPAEQESANLTWLAQRITGRPSAELDDSVLPALQAIMTAEEPFITKNWWAANNPYAKYIPVCAALALSAEALYF